MTTSKNIVLKKKLLAPQRLSISVKYSKTKTTKLCSKGYNYFVHFKGRVQVYTIYSKNYVIVSQVMYVCLSLCIKFQKEG